MADDLASFIESQKRKLEKERSEILLGQGGEDRSRTSPRGNKPDERHFQGDPAPSSEPRSKVKGLEEDNSIGGLKLGGYEKHQEKLRQERKEEYRKYLAEKNFRSSGKVDPILLDNRKPPVSGYNSTEKQSRRDENDSGDYLNRSRRKGKENLDDSERVYDNSGRYGSRKPENLFESYEDLLQRKRAQERRYRGDDSDFGPERHRPSRLDAPQYKETSRSDGYLSRRYDDEYDDWSYSRNRPRARREKSFESKRVHFHDEDDLDDGSWVKPRGRLDYFDDEEDEDEWIKVPKKGKRPQRRNSAHLPESRDPPKEESFQRSKTDSVIRSQSVPLEGSGFIGGSGESKSAQARKKEQYKRDLQQQMQEQADIKKREKMLHLGVQQDGGRPMNSLLNETPPDLNRGLYGQVHAQGYNTALANHGPSSRPTPLTAVYSNPYGDPYYSYGELERGGPQGSSLNAFRGTGQGNVGPSRGLVATTSGGAVLSSHQGGNELSRQSGFQPPGGYSSIGGADSDQASVDKKKATQLAYQEELKKQMQERNERKQKEKEDKERYDRKIEQEAANFNPWGKGGGGAPLRDSAGHLVANLRTLKQLNDQGGNASPKDQSPPVEARFDATIDPFQSPRHEAVSEASPVIHAAGQAAGQEMRTGFGRSDPLKEAQPQDDLKKAARLEYQEFLRKQVEEKEKKKKEELEKVKKEEEELERRIEEDRLKMQKDFEEEQEKTRKKEEEVRLRNEQIKEEQEAKRREAETKKKEMEEQRQAELKRKLDAEIAAKKAASGETGSSSQARGTSPPIPTVLKKMEEESQDMSLRSSSPPIPTIAKKQTSQGPVSTPPPLVAVRSQRQQEPVRGTERDQDVLSQLTALRQQLKNEEKRVQQQMDHTSSVTKYSDIQRLHEDLGSRRGRRDVEVFQRALASKTAVAKRETEGFSAADEFNRIKFEDTSSLAGEFRSKFPEPVSTSSVLDLQQQAYLTEQEDKLAELRSADADKGNTPSLRGGQTLQVSRRPPSRDSLLESDSQFLAVDDPKQMLTLEQMSSRPRQSSARERRRWKQLEEMARNPKPSEAYKPPTPGGFSLNSVTSFNVDEVATRNEERLKRLEMIQRGAGQGGRVSLSGDPDRVLQKFMEERSRPSPLPSRNSEASLEAETSFQPM
ncbi:centrosome and spindle pole-associated protein 1-like isoform X1 [Montipora capricornis]|uniref:centrosome and spindle pole-associated protein 1-like isoform X1 n=1 Tax=Montipora capricornis TaxID=246305 RepID=UPI0035F1E085